MALKQLLVFTNPTCAPCKKLKEDLKKENIPYTEVDTSKNENSSLAAKFSVRHNPTLVGIDVYDMAHTLIGFRKISDIKEAFGII